MNYYYDILVNLQDIFYEFYEWEKTDDLIAIKKTPLFKVKHDVIGDFLNNEIRVSEKMAMAVYEKTIAKNKKERFSGFILTDSKTSIFVEINKEGNVIYRSKLLVEDENNINEISSTMKGEYFTYTIGKPLKKNFLLRQTVSEKNIIYAELKSIEKDKNVDKCRYLFYECFHKMEDNFAEALQALYTKLNQADTLMIHELYRLILITYQEKL